MYKIWKVALPQHARECTDTYVSLISFVYTCIELLLRDLQTDVKAIKRKYAIYLRQSIQSTTWRLTPSNIEVVSRQRMTYWTCCFWDAANPIDTTSRAPACGYDSLEMHLLLPATKTTFETNVSANHSLLIQHLADNWIKKTHPFAFRLVIVFFRKKIMRITGLCQQNFKNISKIKIIHMFMFLIVI